MPVAKGNGYGFTLGPAGPQGRSGWASDTLAVGTYEELPEVASRFDGDLLVLTPWRPFARRPRPRASRDRVIHTVSRPDDLDALLARQPDARLVLERLTCMLRHGLTARELWDAARAAGRSAEARLEGIALHLPLGAGLPPRARWPGCSTDVVGAGLDDPPTVWVSHLTDDELDRLRTSYADFTFRPRIGTGLWLGDREALQVTATVLDVHEVERGDAFGYRGRTAPKAGHVLVVSGGTAHGIGLESPTGESSLKARAATVARGGLDAVGLRALAVLDRRQAAAVRRAAAHAGLDAVPARWRPGAEVGDEIDVRVRYTATTFDRVVVV